MEPHLPQEDLLDVGLRQKDDGPFEERKHDLAFCLRKEAMNHRRQFSLRPSDDVEIVGDGRMPSPSGSPLHFVSQCSQKCVMTSAGSIEKVAARPGRMIGYVGALTEVALDGFGDALGLVHAVILPTNEGHTKDVAR